MAIIKKKELRKMGTEESTKKLIELRKELMKSNAQVYSGTTPENPGRIRTIKKTIARIIHKQHMEVKQKQ